MSCAGTYGPLVKVNRLTRSGECRACGARFSPMAQRVAADGHTPLAPTHEPKRRSWSEATFEAGPL